METEDEKPKTRKVKQKAEDKEVEAPAKKRAPRAKKADADFDETEEKIAYWKDGRMGKIAGMVFLLASFIMAVGFTSYFFNVADDQSEVANRALTALTDNSVKVQNALGRVGAVVAHFFIHDLFGVASYLCCLMAFVTGFNLLMQKKIFNVLKVVFYSSLGLVWASAFLAFANSLVQPASLFSWGGGFGDYLTGPEGELTGLLKVTGTAALLFVTALAALVWIYNFNFDFLLKPFSKNEVAEMGTAATTQPQVTVPVFRDESENIFAKDRLHDDVRIEPELLTPENLESDEDDEELVLTTKVPAEVPFSTDMEITNSDTDLEMEIEEVKEEPMAVEKGSLQTNYDPKLDLSNYKLPPLELLEEYGSERMKYDPEELERNKNQIIATLNNYQIEISKIKATIGPTVTLYEIVPAPGVRISKIKNLEDDIALSLAALGIRIIAPIPGKGTVGIEVPNMNKEVVSMRSLLASEKFQNSNAELPICLGKSISNEILVADLAKMPHLLMAGATGQGKSVGINAILVSLLYKKHPSQLKFVMVDPKKVELSLYEMLEKHFLAKLPNEQDAIITDTKKVVQTLNALCMEMDNRYDLLKKAQVRNLKEYNHKFVNRQLNPANGHQFLPYIVLVVDEFADLIMTAGKEVEMPIARLAQLARAIGIHLILATQRPSVNIITGTIKANFPARIAFKTTSKIDSRTILDAGGSEQLIGRGDMLLSQGSDMIRLQCGFVDTPEVERVRDFISNQQGYAEAFLLPDYVDPNELKGDGDFSIDGERDELFEDAARVIVQNQMGSTSLLQRRMKLGYNRAGRLMDQLHEAGIVGENLGSKAREVKIKTEAELEQYLQKLREVV
ncbi:MAG: DNA translocase FtsK 4TM domain-containing protein [Chitinophagales bacterium]